MAIPSVKSLHSEIYSLAMDPETTTSKWSSVLRAGSDLRTVYVFQILDALLSPADGTIEDTIFEANKLDEEGIQSPKMSKWAEAFCATGGFSAVCTEITHSKQDMLDMPPQGWKAVVRIIRVCIVAVPTLANGDAKVNAPELASHLLALVNTNYENGLDSAESNNNNTENKENQDDFEIAAEDAQAMVDASLDALIIVKLLLGDTCSGKVGSEEYSNQGSKVRDHIFTISALPTLLTEVQLRHPSVKVRQATSAFARELALADTESAEDIKRCLFVFDIMLNHIFGSGSGPISRSYFNSTCADYFTVLESLVPALRAADKSTEGFSWTTRASIVNKLMSTLDAFAEERANYGSALNNGGFSADMLDSDSQDQDSDFLGIEHVSLSSMFGGTPTVASGPSKIMSSPFLIGMLSVLSECIRDDSAMIGNNLGPNFVEKIFTKFLYSVPCILDKDAWPVCRGSRARKEAFRLLYHLMEPDRQLDYESQEQEFYHKNRAKLANLIESYRSTVPMDKIGWKMQPLAVRRETAFAGLVNQGCTCYMNATLQQLYLIRSIRDNVLSSPPSPIIRSRSRERIDLNLVFQNSSNVQVTATEAVPVNEKIFNNLDAQPIVDASPIESSVGAVIEATSLVNKKVEVQWESGKWYSGEIKACDKKRGLLTLVYEDDGERVEWDPRQGRPTKEKPGAICFAAPEMNEEEQAQQVLEMTRTVFRFLKDSQRRSYDPKAFVESCRALKMEFGPYQQNDSAEFLALLMDRIETGLKSNPKHCLQGHKQMAVLTQTMKGETVKMMNYECKDYGNHTKRRYGEEVVIPLKVTGGVKTLERALEEYTKPEIMDGDNKCECDECRQQMEEKGLDEEIEAKAYKRKTELRDAFNESKIPNILVLSLRRFELDFETFETVKRNDVLEFPQILNMYKYTQAYFDEQRKEKVDVIPKGANHKQNHSHVEEIKDEVDADKAGLSQGPRCAKLSEYDYQLRGIVIHAGVAGAGHYWSLGRTSANYNRSTIDEYSDLPMDSAGYDHNKATWYKFDDDNVTPFREEDIPYEAFGGVEKTNASGTNKHYSGQKERSTNAVMLFYERINPVAITVPPKSDDTNQDKVQNDGVAEEIVDQSEAEVWSDNERHVRLQHLFDKEYAAFLLRCLNSHINCSTRHSITISAPSADTADVRDSFVKSCICHFLDVVLHGTNKSAYIEWLKSLKLALHESPDVSRWFLEQICSNNGGALKTWLNDFTLGCSVKNSRIAFKELVVEAVSTVVAHFPHEIDQLRCEARNEVAEFDVSSVLMFLCEDIVHLVKRCWRFWARWAQLFELIRRICSMVPEIAQILRIKGILSVVVNIYLNVDSPEKLQLVHGKIGLLGNQYNTPNFGPLATCISALLGIVSDRAPLSSSGESNESQHTLTPKCVRALCYVFSLAANKPAAFEPFRKLYIQSQNSSGKEQEILLSNLCKRAMSGDLDQDAVESGDGLTIERDELLDFMMHCTNNGNLGMPDQIVLSKDSPKLERRVDATLVDYGDGTSMNLSGFLSFYLTASKEEGPPHVSIWNDLSLHNVSNDLSLPGIPASEGSSDIPCRNASVTIVPDDGLGRHDGRGTYPAFAVDKSHANNYKIVKEHTRKLDTANGKLPDLCLLAVRSSNFLKAIASQSDSNLVAAVLDSIVSSDPKFVVELTPVMVHLIQDHSSAYELRGENDDDTFIEKCVEIIAPMLTPPSADQGQESLKHVAEWFLFGQPPTSDTETGSGKPLQDNGFVGAAKIYAEHSIKSRQHYDACRIAYKMICIVERLYHRVPSCKRILDLTCTASILNQSPDCRLPRDIKWDWVIGFAKDCTLYSHMGGDDRTYARSKLSVSIIDSLVQIHNQSRLHAKAEGMTAEALIMPATPYISCVDFSGAPHNSIAKEIAGANTKIVVKGCGSAFCDGTYVMDGYFDSVPKWSKVCTITSQDKMGNRVQRNARFTMFRVLMQNKQSRQWYLSEMDPLKPGTNKDIDYYCCSSAAPFPPSHGWRQVGQGWKPPPASIEGNAQESRGPGEISLEEEKWSNQTNLNYHSNLARGQPAAPSVQHSGLHPPIANYVSFCVLQALLIANLPLQLFTFA